MRVAALVLIALTQQPAPREPLRLYAVGDINLGRAVGRDHLAKGDTVYPFRELLDTLRDADLLFGNLESPIAPPGHAVEASEWAFTAPAAAAAALARAGFDVVSTANNHAWDGGRAGVIETLERLARAGVLSAGTGPGRPLAEQPVIVRRHGWRVAFFAVTRVFNAAPDSFSWHEGANYVAWGDTAWLYPALRRLRPGGRADLVVVSVHGGEEYAERPVGRYLAFLEGLVDAGADLVLGHHPHVLQSVIWYRGRPIAPSLGNFIFDQRDPWTQLSAILRVAVAPDRSMRLSAIPVRAGAQTRLADGPARDSVQSRLGLPLSPTATRP